MGRNWVYSFVIFCISEYILEYFETPDIVWGSRYLRMCDDLTNRNRNLVSSPTVGFFNSRVR